MKYIEVIELVFLLSVELVHSFQVINRFGKLKLRQHDAMMFAREEVDVAVIGGGIGGTTIAWLLQDQHNLKVALIDPRADQSTTWYPNYGEWQDEWYMLSERLKLPELKECTTHEWNVTDCFFGGSFGTVSCMNC
jgi:hypothetical protein